jgi:hypothetical protein
MLSSAMEKLKDSLSCCTYNGAQHTQILITESDPKAVLRKVTLTTSNGDWFSFNPDKGRKGGIMSPLLATGKEHDHHRACDCVIAIKRDKQLHIIYIDLKSNNPKGYIGQFKSTRQFLRYALGLLEDFHGEKFSVPEERYVILYGGKPALLNKQPTVPNKEKMGKTRPDAPYKRRMVDSGKLYLKELLR